MEINRKKRLLAAWSCMVFLAMVTLIFLQYHAFTEYNEIRAYRDSDFLISETEKIIAGNDADRNYLHQFLKDSYLEKAKTASFIIDSQPWIQRNSQELWKVAKTIGVDQIHLFDKNGVIYGGTNPEYYGMTMDDGEQIGFFKPMLRGQARELSQDITPNTAEGKVMLYAMCWNKEGTHLVQVGGYGNRFPRLLSRNRIDMFMDLVPDDPARDIILTDVDSDVIVASNNELLLGKRLSDVGIFTEEEITEAQLDFATGFSYEPILCSAKQYRDFNIYIAQYKGKLDESIPVTLFTFFEYLSLVFIAMSFIIDYYYDKFIQAKTYAMRDKLTDLYSRRAYEMAMSDMEHTDLDENLVFVSMDVNGLKNINDTLGHKAGDLLLKGAAYCMRTCFSEYGKIYRFGGDEFAAIIFAKKVELQPLREYLDKLCLLWSQENGIEVSVSFGFASLSDHPEATIQDLESIADQAMYEDKTRYYSMEKHDRRGVSHEDQ